MMRAPGFSAERSGRSGRERGSGTVLGLGVMLGITVLLSLVAGVVGVVVQHRGVQTAADQAALAAADTLLGFHPGEPCVRAAQVVGALENRLISCEVLEDRSTRVRVAPRGSLSLPVEGRSRAGPRP